MAKRKITRRNFIDKTASGILGAVVASGTSIKGSSGKTLSGRLPDPIKESQIRTVSDDFTREVENILPLEKPYDYHKRLSVDPVHLPARDFSAVLRTGEMSLSLKDWKLVWNNGCSIILQNAVQDFQDYMDKSMGIRIEVDGRDSIEGWQNLSQCIVVGTRDQMLECGAGLKGSKDYEIITAQERVTICGYDERGAMYGLYNLEARMNLREAPFLPADLKTVRHSLYDLRLVHSWMGWMEWPDSMLSHLAHDGFDGIFAFPQTNPNGDRTTVETSTDFYARLLYRIRKVDPARVRDLIDRAARYGIKVYTQIIHQYLGTPESEAQLRRLVRAIVKEFPDIHGYILLTEGFWYKKWGGGHGASKEYIEDWARNWSRAVGIVAEECHRVNPAIEILPWEYNINFHPKNVETKRYFIRQLPLSTIPLLTWENGKSFELEGMQGSLTDYAISQIGPAEVTEAQIAEAHQRGMKVYTNADTFVCGAQLQTVPYHPFPYQWYERYKAMEEHGVKGTLESWTTGYNPNFMTRLRAWYCWDDAPRIEELLDANAVQIFGTQGKDKILKAWDLFSQAVRLVPDTGPTMGTSNSIGNPLFFSEPVARTATFRYSWTDQEAWTGYLGGELNPYWPYTVSRLVFYPDFSNQVNKAEEYARSKSGVILEQEEAVLPAFLKRLRQASGLMEEGLVHYRNAALGSLESKRIQALREVIIAEQLQRTLQSNHAILEFEDLRLQFVKEKDEHKAGNILDRMEGILHEEIDRTELSLLAVTRDSRLGFQQECDYVYTPYSLKEKLGVLHETLDKLIPASREKMS